MAKGKDSGGGWDSGYSNDDGQEPEVISKYNASDFVYPAQDHQGHSERIWCRVQPMYDRQIDVVLRSRKFPFKTKGDVIRFAVCSTLKRLEKMEPMPGFLGRAEAVNSLVRDEMYFMEFMQMFENMERVIGQHLSMNAKTEAQRMVAKAKAEIMKIEEPFWRLKCSEELSKRFGHLLSDHKRVTLNKKGAEAAEAADESTDTDTDSSTT